jgi:hypothetical protein
MGIEIVINFASLLICYFKTKREREGKSKRKEKRAKTGVKKSEKIESLSKKMYS